MYLIRRDYESFIGPYPLDKVKQAYSRMEFGISDEICSSLNPWVKIENTDRLKRKYPEVYAALFKPKSSKQGTTNWDKTPNKTQEAYDFKLNTQPFLKLLFGLLFIAALGAGSYYGFDFIKQKLKFSSQKIEPFSRYKLRIDRLYNTQGLFSLQDYFRSNINGLITHAKTNSDAFSYLLPYLRYYAFTDQGYIEGFDQKFLKGKAGDYAPNDCSQSLWVEQWDSINFQTPEQMDSISLTKETWFRLLLWDKDWLIRRKDKGWLEPQNYYLACLQMGLVSLDSIEPKNFKMSQSIYNIIRSRLVYLINSIQLEKNGDPSIVDPFTLLTCLEASSSVSMLNSCKRRSNMSKLWTSFILHRESLQYLRLILEGDDGNARQAFAQLKRVQQFSSVDPLTQLDMSPEKNMILLLLGNSMNVNLAIKRSSHLFPYIVFK